MANPKEGTTGWIDNWMVGYSLKDKPKMKKVAEEWLNFTLGEQVQVGYVRKIAQLPVNLSIKDKLTPEEVKSFHLDDPDFFKNHLIPWEILTKREQNGFKTLNLNTMKE